MDVRDLVALEGPGARDAVKRLEERGVVERATREDRAPAHAAELQDTAGPPPVPNEEQARAIEAILPFFDDIQSGVER